ncbi:MAG: LPP20 family lipoprotein [Bacteroidales bacterium]|nr:LPP20 family lipoprotein [Bacteroidales bacterium]
MKRLSLLTIALFCALTSFAQAPSWVTSRPVSESKYVGIGMARLTDKDCQNVAMTNAMLEIATQISVNIESSSFMQTVDVDGRSKSLFEEKVKESVAAHIEGQNLKGTYNDGTYYYVYYELDKKAYEKQRKARRERGISLGLDWYEKGQAAESMNNCSSAIQMYAQGLKAIEPYLYLDLTTERHGDRFDVATELYDAYVNVFTGFDMVQNTAEVGVEAFKASGEPLTVCLTRQGTPMPNVLLKAEFVGGEGELTPPVKTDAEGIATFYIKNVTSKQSIQNVDVTIDDSFLSSLPASYRQLIDKDTWPSARFTAVLMNPNHSAYMMVEKNDLEACEKQVRSILANNYFELTEDTAAELFVTLSTEMEIGDSVHGEMYDMNECFASLTLKVYDNIKQTQLVEYSVTQVKVLVPADKSEAQAKAMCTRELMKRVNAGLPKELKKMNIN